MTFLLYDLFQVYQHMSEAQRRFLWLYIFAVYFFRSGDRVNNSIPGRLQGCRTRGKPVIVATNMLESMIQNPAPTRAEVSDISIAVREGTDAVMLSGETAYGAHPLKSMQTMSIVAKRTEYRCGRSPPCSSYTRIGSDRANPQAQPSIAHSLPSCLVLLPTVALLRCPGLTKGCALSCCELCCLQICTLSMFVA